MLALSKGGLCGSKRGSISVFMSDRMTRAEGEQTGAGDLFSAYLDWCRARGLVPLDVDAFNGRLRSICETVGIRRVGGLLVNVKLAS